MLSITERPYSGAVIEIPTLDWISYKECPVTTAEQFEYVHTNGKRGFGIRPVQGFRMKSLRVHDINYYSTIFFRYTVYCATEDNKPLLPRMRYGVLKTGTPLSL